MINLHEMDEAFDAVHIVTYSSRASSLVRVGTLTLVEVGCEVRWVVYHRAVEEPRVIIVVARKVSHSRLTDVPVY